MLAGLLPPAGHIFEKWRPLKMLKDFLNFFLQFSSRVLAGVLPPAGQIFEKWRPLQNIQGISKLVFFSNRVLAGVLPPAGQFFEK